MSTIKKASELTYGDTIIAAVTATGNAPMDPIKVDAVTGRRDTVTIWYADNMRDFFALRTDEFEIE